MDFVKLKLRLLRNGFRGQPWRVALFVIGSLFGLWVSVMAFIGLGATATASRDTAFVVIVLAGSVLVLAWVAFPLLFFGVDETLDPARFALLPVRRLTLARGMLASAFVGIPPVATLIATLGMVAAAAFRFDAVAAAAAMVGVLAGLILGVIASRAVTSAFAALLRSRRMRDLAAVIIALLASSIGPLQWLAIAAADRGRLDQALSVANVFAWTPLGAPYALPFDVAEGRWLVAAARLAITLAVVVALLVWWSRTIETAMLGATGSSGAAAKRRAGKPGGAVASLIPRPLRGLLAPNAFAAILARESRFWWRDPRRRASLISILIASAVLPIALQFASNGGFDGGAALRPDAPVVSNVGFSIAITVAGTMGGMLLANQFAFDGTAFAAHLLHQPRGRVEVRARALALALVCVPALLAVVVAVTVLAGTPGQVPAGIGMLGAGFGASIAAASVLSVLAPYALPETTNPFALNSGGGSAKGLLAFVAMLGTGVISAPIAIAANVLRGPVGSWLVLVVGIVYGVGAALFGTGIAGRVLDRRGPELLVAVTPRR